MDIMSGLLTLGSLGLGVVSYNRSRTQAQQSEQHYYREAALNQQIGQYNYHVIAMTGAQNLAMSAKKTAELVSAQRHKFAAMGMSSTEGSAREVMLDTFDMGMQEAVSISMNTQIEQTNALFAAKGASAAATGRASQSRYEKHAAGINIFKTFLDGAKGIAADQSADKLKTQRQATAKEFASKEV